MADFHTRLRAARLACGLKQRELAARLDVDAMQVSRWERTVTPVAGTIRRLARELGVSIDWLMTGDGKGPDPARDIAPATGVTRGAVTTAQAHSPMRGGEVR